MLTYDYISACMHACRLMWNTVIVMTPLLEGYKGQLLSKDLKSLSADLSSLY